MRTPTPDDFSSSWDEIVERLEFDKVEAENLERAFRTMEAQASYDKQGKKKKRALRKGKGLNVGGREKKICSWCGGEITYGEAHAIGIDTVFHKNCFDMFKATQEDLEGVEENEPYDQENDDGRYGA